MSAIAPEYAELEDFALIDKLSELAKVAEPNAIKEIRNAEIRHNTVVDVDKMQDAVKNILGIK